MTPNDWRPRVVRAALLSALLITPLFLFADRSALSRLAADARPAWAGVAALVWCTVLFARAERFRLVLARGRVRAPFLRTVAWHQVVFAVLPSGLGDLFFPPIARRELDASLSEATGALLLTRLQDLCALVAMASIGVALSIVGVAETGIVGSPLVWGAMPASLGLLYFADRVVATGVEALGAIATRLGLPGAARIEAFRDTVDRSRVGGGAIPRLSSSLWTMASWIGAATFFACVFRTYDLSLSAVESLLVVVGINLSGALAFFTLAGFGVSEAGLVAVLVVLGTSADDAAAQALAIRPTALVLSVGTPLVLLGAARLLRGGSD